MQTLALNSAKFKRLLVTSASFAKNSILIQECRELCEELILNSAGLSYSENQLLEELSKHNPDALIIGTEPLTQRVISQFKQVRAVGKYGVGLDNIDLDALKQKQIFFGWTPGVNRRCVSELVLGFMLGHCRNIFRSSYQMQQASWDKNGGVQLTGKTVGVVGFGHVGQDLAALIRPFGCQIIFCDILNKTHEASKYLTQQVSYQELISRADIITFHVPGGKDTAKMYSVSEIQKTQPHCLVINTARGSVLDFEAVCTAVKQGKLGGFASDVFPSEPLLSENFPVEEGFYFTPHIGGNAQEAVLDMGRSAISHLKSYLGSQS